MRKSVKCKNSAAKVQAGPDIAASLEKIQQQLAVLEKKMDILINRAPQKAFAETEKVKSAQFFDNSSRNEKAGWGNGFRQRNYFKAICADCNSECEVPFKPSSDRPVYCKECFAERKKNGTAFKAKFEHIPKEETSLKERNLDTPPAAEKRSPAGRKKLSQRRRKERA